MDDYLKLLRRRLTRAKDQAQKRKVMGDALNCEGFRMLGYYQGRASILEDAIDEIEDQVEKAK